jgi:hypothetical protein
MSIARSYKALLVERRCLELETERLRAALREIIDPKEHPCDGMILRAIAEAALAAAKEKP